MLWYRHLQLRLTCYQTGVANVLGLGVGHPRLLEPEPEHCTAISTRLALVQHLPLHPHLRIVTADYTALAAPDSSCLQCARTADDYLIAADHCRRSIQLLMKDKYIDHGLFSSRT